jgi:hypothetical protein
MLIKTYATIRLIEKTTQIGLRDEPKLRKTDWYLGMVVITTYAMMTLTIVIEVLLNTLIAHPMF